MGRATVTQTDDGKFQICDEDGNQVGALYNSREEAEQALRRLPQVKGGGEPTDDNAARR